MSLALVISACLSGRASLRGGLAKERVAQFPANVATAYDLFAVRCSRCHTLSRPLGAAIYDHAHWKNYVDRMRRHPGSGISPKDAETILVFLRYYADQKAIEAGLRAPPQKDAPKGATP